MKKLTSFVGLCLVLCIMAGSFSLNAVTNEPEVTAEFSAESLMDRTLYFNKKFHIKSNYLLSTRVASGKAIALYDPIECSLSLENKSASQDAPSNNDILTDDTLIEADLLSSSAEDDAQSKSEVGLTRKEQCWLAVSQWFDNPIAIAAVMGNIGVESNFCPWRYCGDNDVDSDYSASKAYINQIMEQSFKDSRNQFKYFWLYNYQGYGLFQFSTNSHMERLYDLAMETGARVDDISLQVDYMLNNFKTKRPECFEAMEQSTDLVDATEIFRKFGEGSTYNERSIQHRFNRAVECYEEFTGLTYDGEFYLPMYIGGSCWRYAM